MSLHPAFIETIMTEVVRVCPPEETFIDIKLHIKCPYKDCDKVVPQSGSLHKHLVKFHGAIKDENDEINTKKLKNGKGPVRLQTQYHCPRAGCIYGVEQQRHFTNINLLRQHYWKVHAEKKYECEKCGCGFGMEKDKRAHEERCGTIYKCMTCNCSYRSVEAILTHCRRKEHEVPDAAKRKSSKHTRKESKVKTDDTTSQSQSSAFTGQSSTSLYQTSSSEVKTGITPSANSQVPANVFIVNVVQPVVQTELNSEKWLKPILPKPVSFCVVPVAPATVCTNDDRTVSTGDGMKSSNQNTALPVPIQPIKTLENVGKTDLLHVDTQTKSVSTGTQHSPGSPRVRRNSVNLQKRRKSMTGTSATSTGIQTSISIIPHKKKCLKNVAQTQTAGDFILKTAMATAEIPIQSESVGTQITPKSKSKQIRPRNTCSIETQTSNMANTKRRRRKRLYGPGPGPSVKTDSICQTVDMNRTVSVEPLVNPLSKSMVNESAQTVVMVDENSQTVPYHVLQNHLYNQNVRSEREKMQTAYAASKYFQNLGRNIFNGSVKERIDNLENENMNAMKILSITEKGGISVSVNMNGNSTGRPNMCSNSKLNSRNNGSQQCHSSNLSKHAQSTVCDTGVQASSSMLPEGLTVSRTQARTTAEASTSLNGGENVNMKAFESEWINFLTKCDLYIANNGKHSFTPHFPTTSANEYSFNCLSSSHDLSANQNSKAVSSSVSMATDSNHSPVGTKSTFSVQTDSSHTDFPQYPTADMEVQTLTSADDIDQLLLNTVCSGIQTDDTYPLMNIHTQTADDFDVFDLFMNNMETQTPDDLLFDGFSLADIETQTPNEIGHHNLQTTAATQTNSGTQSNIIQNKSDAANMETQTPYQGLFDFPVNKAQATWQDLDEILSELNKNY